MYERVDVHKRACVCFALVLCCVALLLICFGLAIAGTSF